MMHIGWSGIVNVVSSIHSFPSSVRSAYGSISGSHSIATPPYPVVACGHSRSGCIHQHFWRGASVQGVCHPACVVQIDIASVPECKMCDPWSSLLMKAVFDTTPSAFIDVIFMDVLSSLRSRLLPCLLVQFPCAGSGIITYSCSWLASMLHPCCIHVPHRWQIYVHFSALLVCWTCSWLSCAAG